jgi:pimeloyl-ACP methyl ester carboxylesterase
MARATLGDVELEYERRGHGDHVVFVHHGAGTDWFAPLCAEPSLAGRYGLVRYHRAGYGGSSLLTGQLTFENEAETFRALMRHLGIERAHVVGHSASGCICLQLALSAAEVVHSVVVIEPALMAVPSPPGVPRAIELFREGKTAEAVETFIVATCGADARVILENALPGAMEQTLADAATFFGHELPALRQWSFGANEARRITQPVLAVLGERSDSRFYQRQELLLDWLPNVEPLLIPDAGHLLQFENPRSLAEGMTAFFSDHPIGVGV